MTTLFRNRFWALLVLVLAALSGPAGAQSRLVDDGFQRRNGQMSIVRHGQPHPLTRDVHLPTGAVVTKDGFLIDPAGQRTELREGQGCDLRGRLVAVNEAKGYLTLADPVEARGADREEAAQTTQVSLLDELLSRAHGRGWYKKGKKGKHGHGKHKERDEDD